MHDLVLSPPFGLFWRPMGLAFGIRLPRRRIPIAAGGSVCLVAIGAATTVPAVMVVFGRRTRSRADLDPVRPPGP